VGWFHHGGSSDLLGHIKRLLQALSSPYHSSSLASPDCVECIEKIISDASAASVFDAVSKVGHKSPILFNYLLGIISSSASPDRRVPMQIIPLLQWLCENTRRIFSIGTTYPPCCVLDVMILSLFSKLNF
jgi:hypothetical protein